MLPEIDKLYLGTSVLILLDLTYMSRFWTIPDVAGDGDSTTRGGGSF